MTRNSFQRGRGDIAPSTCFSFSASAAPPRPEVEDVFHHLIPLAGPPRIPAATPQAAAPGRAGSWPGRPRVGPASGKRVTVTGDDSDEGRAFITSTCRRAPRELTDARKNAARTPERKFCVHAQPAVFRNARQPGACRDVGAPTKKCVTRAYKLA